MKPEDLKGRELAAYLSGLIEADRHEKGGGFDINRSGMILAAAEIERLCAERAPRSKGADDDAMLIYRSEIDKAARDAAALDNIGSMLELFGSGYGFVDGSWTNRQAPADTLAKIIERTGRKIGA